MVRRRTDKKERAKILVVLIGMCLSILWVLQSFESIKMTQIESVNGVPTEIVADAFSSGLIPLMIWGSAEERHDFGKGRATRFGQMSFSADDFLKHTRGWSEEKIHDLGHELGFSERWSR